MNRFLRFALAAPLLMGGAAFAQLPAANDSVVTGQGYANDVYYSFDEGTRGAVDRKNWDIAFQIAIPSSILVNADKGIQLYKGQPIAEWATADTTGRINLSNRLVNSNKSWDYGAFNSTADLNSDIDPGWGTYDMGTHTVTGDSLFFLKVNDTTFKKIWIVARYSGQSSPTGESMYRFRIANLDGSDEIERDMVVSQFAGKQFAYYTVAGDLVDREPVNVTEWDLLFTKFIHVFEEIPISQAEHFYAVTGALSNPNVAVAEVITDNMELSDTTGLTWSEEINAVGDDWKAFNNQTFQWTWSDSTVFFVRDQSGDIWRLIFTGFSGSGSGKYLFNKTLILTSSVTDKAGAETRFAVAPNPGRSVNFLYELQNSAASVQVRVADAQGRIVMQRDLPTSAGFRSLPMDGDAFAPGLYVVTLSVDGQTTSQRWLNR